MYLIKDLTKAISDGKAFNKVPLNFPEYHSTLDFGPYVDKSKKLDFERTRFESHSLIADTIASAIVTLVASNLTNEQFVPAALENCKQILFEQGYETAYPSDLFYERSANTNNVILVLGCQTVEIIKARVKKAIELLQMSHKQFDCVFSGRNPSGQECNRKVEIENEAKYMEELFNTLFNELNRDQLPSNIERIGLEERSHNTITNIKEFLAGDFLSGKEPNDVYIVSSTFHLIRLAQILETAILSSNQIPQINRIILVGAEDPISPSEVAYLPVYVKCMMHTIYDFLLTNN